MCVENTRLTRRSLARVTNSVAHSAGATLICYVLQHVGNSVTTDTHRGASILIVEDDRQLADLYAVHLPEEYNIEVAYGGEEALALLDKPFDVVLLDRRMPVVSGNEVLATIRSEGLDCRVAMVTGATPDFDIVELQIDAYLVNPVSPDELRKTVRRLLKLDTYNDRLQELSAKKLKRHVLEVEQSATELEHSVEFQQLNDEIQELEAEIAALAYELDDPGDDPGDSRGLGESESAGMEDTDTIHRTDISRPEETDAGRNTEFSRPEETDAGRNTEFSQPEETDAGRNTEFSRPDDTDAGRNTEFSKSGGDDARRGTEIHRPGDTDTGRSSGVPTDEGSDSDGTSESMNPGRTEDERDTDGRNRRDNR